MPCPRRRDEGLPPKVEDGGLPALRGGKVNLRPTQSDDLGFLQGLWNDGEVMRYVGFPQGLCIDEPTLLTAARFKAQHHLSLADALIASFACRHRAILVHKDPEFAALAEQLRQEPLPYKLGE